MIIKKIFVSLKNILVWTMAFLTRHNTIAISGPEDIWRLRGIRGWHRKV